MSARFASPVLAPAVPEILPASSSQLVFGPPPGLAYPMGVSSSPALSNTYSHTPPSNVEASQTNGSAYGESFPFRLRGEGVPGQSMSTERRTFPVRKIYYRS